ncbi:ankyrin-like protein [Phytophthora cinnamomi]|uniref:ankyrin-like protein n=1 Tax=Phytophthora cinnamomi TaxID=4785 RepID=UPI00355A79F8|nr:ankyrin-like protein [Phytophthora cinnamomi]
MGRRRSKWKDNKRLDRGSQLLHHAKAGDCSALAALLEESELESQQEFLQLTQDHNGSTALHLAASEGHCEMVRTLLQLGAGEVHLGGGRRKYARTPLHEAAINGHLEVCRLLVDFGLLVDCHTTRGRTPLMYAVKGNYVELARYLVKEAGANVDEQNEMGVTAVYIACQDGHEDMLRFLAQEAQADVNLSNRTNHAPLHEAVAGGFTAVVDFMLRNGANKYVVDKMGVTVWHEAAGNGSVEMLELLVQHDVSLHPNGQEQVDKVMARHPFHYAAVEGKADFVQALLEKKLVDVNFVDIDGCTALYYAAANGHVDVLQVLLRFGGNPNIASIRRSPLHCAVEWHRVECVLLMLQHGAAMEATDKDGLTPAKVAAQKGFHDLVAILQAGHGAAAP